MAKAEAVNSDIRYNLMTVVPDKRLAIMQRLSLLQNDRSLVTEALQQLTKKADTCDSERLSEETKLEFPQRRSTDYTTPLTVLTSPAPSSSSTDTASEIGSAFNSPVPTNTFQTEHSKFLIIKVSSKEPDEGTSSVETAEPELPATEASASEVGLEKGPDEDSPEDAPPHIDANPQHKSENPSESLYQSYALQDLSALIKNLETEISHCEG